VNRSFHRLTGVGAHGEPAGGDVNSPWFSDWHATGDWRHGRSTRTPVYKMPRLAGNHVDG
jgi:hypothetical protein